MAVENLGEAWRLGWKLTARCAFGNRDGMKSIRECIYRAPLDMQTLVWTRGPNFPLSRLESRLMCPDCGSRRVSVLFDDPRYRWPRGRSARRNDRRPATQQSDLGEALNGVAGLGRSVRPPARQAPPRFLRLSSPSPEAGRPRPQSRRTRARDRATGRN